MDRIELLRRLCKLLPADFHGVLAVLPDAQPHVSSAAQAQQATELLRWADRSDRLDELVAVVTRFDEPSPRDRDSSPADDGDIVGEEPTTKSGGGGGLDTKLPDDPLYELEDTEKRLRALRTKLRRLGKPAQRATGARRSVPPQVPDYRLVRVIGSGAYGDVWLSENVVTGRDRAIKIVRRDRFTTPQPFDRELRAVRKYETVCRGHPALLRILHVGRGQGMFYYVMPLADSMNDRGGRTGRTYRPKTLEALLSGGRHQPVAEAVAVVRQLLQGLQVLHDAGLVHRDIKPSSVLFVDGDPVLGDIGLVTERGSEVSALGTPDYMPPEGPGHPRADLFAMGMLLYRMSTGRECRDFATVPTFTRSDDQTAFSGVNKVILRACAKDPERRFPSAQAMCEALS